MLAITSRAVRMTLTLHFWSAYGLTSEQDERLDVERQAREWAGAETNVTACRIVKVDRPYPDRLHWWEITVDLDIATAHPDNLTLFGAA
jgi:hypothetical protein